MIADPAVVILPPAGADEEIFQEGFQNKVFLPQKYRVHPISSPDLF